MIRRGLPVVGIVGTASSVGDAVAEDDECAGVGGCPGFYSADEIPVLGVGAGEGCFVDFVSRGHVRGCSAAWVAGYAAA